MGLGFDIYAAIKDNMLDRGKTLKNVGSLDEVSASKGKDGLSKITVDVVNWESTKELLSVGVKIYSKHEVKTSTASIVLTRAQAKELAQLLNNAATMNP